MAKRRMRKIAKNIAKQPKHKKMMAEYVATHSLHKFGSKEILDILIKGHRGYLAMDETKLSKLFDDLYDKKVKELEKLVGDINSGDTLPWGVSRREEAIQEAKMHIAKAETIYDEIFEEVFL